jgi:hypothetical protein
MARQAGETGRWDSALLPTPTSRDHKGRNQRDDETCLPGAVGNLLPTPRSTRGGSGTETLYALGAERTDKDRPQGEVLLPTPTTAPTTGNGHARNLGGEVKMLPTPEASDSTGGRRSKELGGTRASGAKRAITLATALDHRSTGESIEPPSSDTSECSVEQLRIL